MSKRDHSIFPQDILGSLDKSEKYTGNLTYDEFCMNSMVVDAVVRNFEIIGEAAGHIPTDIRDHYRSIPWDKMKAMRNIMIHEYFGVDLETVWKTAKDALPGLKNEINKTLSESK